MVTYVSKKNWGGASVPGDKVTAGKRQPRNASQAIKWRKSPKRGKAKAISRAQARMLTK